MDLVELVVPFGLVLARVGAWIAACPVWIPDSVPGRIRAILCITLGFVLTLALPKPSFPDRIFVSVMFELLTGIFLGMSTRFVVLAGTFAGELFDIQLGFSFARMVNPMLGEQTGPVTHLVQMIVGLLFFEIDGPLLMMRGLLRSFQIMPAGHARFDLQTALFLSHRFFELMSCGLLLALPIVLTMMVVQMALAFLSRMAPQLNVWSIGLLGTCSLGMVALWCYTPAFIGALAEIWQREALGGFEALR